MMQQEDATMSHPTQIPKKHQFKIITEQELELKKARLQNQNTLNAEKHADRVHPMSTLSTLKENWIKC